MHMENKNADAILLNPPKRLPRKMEKKKAEAILKLALFLLRNLRIEFIKMMNNS